MTPIRIFITLRWPVQPGQRPGLRANAHARSLHRHERPLFSSGPRPQEPRNRNVRRIV